MRTTIENNKLVIIPESDEDIEALNEFINENGTLMLALKKPPSNMLLNIDPKMLRITLD